MIIRIQVIKVYDVETEGGDTEDPAAVQAHLKQVQDMQSTEIERDGKLVDVTTDYAEVVGPSDEDNDDPQIRQRLEYLRQELRAERISTGELVELQSLASHIAPGDVELLEAAGVPENPD